MPSQDVLSPIRRSTDDGAEELPVTPANLRLIECRIHQPSPNRTEAAAAMMHLLSGSSQELKTAPSKAAGKPQKRRYVRRAPKKVGTAKRQIKTAWMEAAPSASKAAADGEGLGRPPPGRKSSVASTEEKKSGEEEGRFIPFREYNRKEKSLGLLCENFLRLYRDDKIAEICLDKAATELGVERRRIYDIVNILESIHLVSRKSKNLYNWHGLASLPVSISAMKQRYAEMQKASPAGSTGTEYPPLKNDRRRGKSLSKLSQMFVQLFLGKEDCIIPLDQAAKELIQMEDSESEEDRLLKTKIRRLYDVANVLVSVGLIEKLQLSNSRKPVFRWRTRNTVSTLNTGESEGKPRSSSSNQLVNTRDDTMQETDIMKSPQSCDSDMFEEGSDSQSDSSSCGAKRKQDDQEGSDDSMSDGESSTKRSRPRPMKPSMSSQDQTSENAEMLLRLDENNMPIHPQIILSEQQEAVKVYMEQYIREYVDYLVLHPEVSGATSKTREAGSRDVNTTADSDQLSLPARREASIAAITKDIHSTPLEF
ncbi:Transcription factor e2f8 [Phytophthora boehmeriae]|uniref:Transcription factor e2f8 n=1 Tax=Phytophthora boehmeriae TaxID=109152 RepID=A0A8T1W222_9STRA|nr:Transcription factor e2f8 [Phytophthora boehmeriae]